MNDGNYNVENFPQLRLITFRRNNGSELEIAFSPGLTILHGRSQAARTTIMRLLRYALGGKPSRISKAELNESENVELEFLANDEQMYVKRSTQTPTGFFEVTDTLNLYRVDERSMAQLLIEKLVIPEIFLRQSFRGEFRDDPLTFNDLSQAFVIDRDKTYVGILNDLYKTKRQETMKLMMGFTNTATAETENRIRFLESERTRLQQQIAHVRSFLNNLNVPHLDEIHERRENLESVLAEFNSQEQLLLQKIQDETINHSNEPQTGRYQQMREELFQKRGEINDTERQKLNLEYQAQEKQELKSVLESELRRIGRHMMSQHVVSTFTFSQCPRCLQKITQEMRERESDENCMLCGRTLLTHNDDTAAWNKAKRDIENTIKEADLLLNNYQESIDELMLKQQSLEDRINWLETTLARETEQFIVPFAEEIRLLAAQRYTVEKNINELDYQQRERIYANELQETTLPQTEKDLEETQRQLSLLQAELGPSVERYNTFLTHFRSFVKNFKSDGYPADDIQWDQKEYLPRIKGQDYKRVVSGPDLVITVLAFHYALLAMGVSSPKVLTNHPKLLLIDEPEQQKMGKERYQKILRLFANLGVKHKNLIQIVIATATDDIPDDLTEYAREI